jgi:hypothetical protein
MKFITTITFLIISYSSFSQITLSEVLGFQNMPYEEIQSSLFKHYKIIDTKTSYYYIPIYECDPPEYLDDGCNWKCNNEDEDGLKSEYPLFDISFVNYKILLSQKSSFAENLDVITKKASTFIEISEVTSTINDNCKNEMRINDFSYSKIIKIQFNNQEHWKYFKNSVIEKAKFIRTDKKKFSDSPITFIYEMKIQLKNGEYKNISIELYENDLVSHAEFCLKLW